MVKNWKQIKRKVRKKERRKDYEQEKCFLQEQISLHYDKLLLPSININYDNVETNSCFDIMKYIDANSHDNVEFNIIPEKNDDLLKCIKVDMLLTNKQKLYFDKWFDATMKIYNRTITYIKKRLDKKSLRELKESIKLCCILKETIKNEIKCLNKIIRNKNKFTKQLNKIYKISKKSAKHKKKIIELIQNIQLCKKQIPIMNIKIDKLNKKHVKMQAKRDKLTKQINTLLDYKRIRTYVLKHVRDNIIEKSQIKNIKHDMKIEAHIMDATIKLACAGYKTCKENYLNGSQKKFRIRYWRSDRKNKVMEIEPGYFKNYEICPKILGSINYRYNGAVYLMDSEKAVKVYYDGDKNIYQLLVTQDVIKCETDSTKYIGIDPGIRTFLTAITNNEAIKIGTEIGKIIRQYLRRIDKIDNNPKISKKRKKIKKAKYNRIISDKVVEMHWKSINYLTDNYKTIIIGKLKMSEVVKNDIDKMTKRVGNLLNHYKFLQRLKYKASIKGVIVETVDERYTSKVCSNCGNYKKELEGEKIYDCKKCKKKIDRDIGGARAIIMKKIILPK
jgi:IS605 OrfB family transposase